MVWVWRRYSAWVVLGYVCLVSGLGFLGLCAVFRLLFGIWFDYVFLCMWSMLLVWRFGGGFDLGLRWLVCCMVR